MWKVRWKKDYGGGGGDSGRQKGLAFMEEVGGDKDNKDNSKDNVKTIHILFLIVAYYLYRG